LAKADSPPVAKVRGGFLLANYFPFCISLSFFSFLSVPQCETQSPLSVFLDWGSLQTPPFFSSLSPSRMCCLQEIPLPRDLETLYFFILQLDSSNHKLQSLRFFSFPLNFLLFQLFPSCSFPFPRGCFVGVGDSSLWLWFLIGNCF